MGGEIFSTKHDAAMRGVILEMARDHSEGRLRNGRIARLLKPNEDGNGLFSLITCASPAYTAWGLNATLSEAEMVHEPNRELLLTPARIRQLRIRNFDVAALDVVPLWLKILWEYEVCEQHEVLTRRIMMQLTVDTIILDGSNNDFMRSDAEAMPERERSLGSLASSVSGLLLPVAQELDLQRFNRIVSGLGYDNLQLP